MEATTATNITKGKARYIMIGGFLGAGKTTAVAKLARRLKDEGSAWASSPTIRVATWWTRPCSGPTASRPFRIRCGGFMVTTSPWPPVSVLVDPVRALRAFGLESGGSFSEKVIYIYTKQLEEADLIVISKCDLLDEARLVSLRKAIAAKFPLKAIMAVSSRSGTNLDEWFARLTSEEQAAGTAMDVDYQVYADGEALLGWLNCTVQISARRVFDSARFLEQLADEAQRRLQAQKAEIAHLKMTLSSDSSLLGEVAAVSLVRNDFVPELSLKLDGPVERGQLIINLRAEAAPDLLATVVRAAVASTAEAYPTMTATLEHLEHFRPGRPQPTHRFETAR
ncbi:MAG: cobalamin biosynthesis protein P47K [Verrucomicrobiota bacterium]|jgi:hypothetical protein